MSEPRGSPGGPDDIVRAQGEPLVTRLSALFRIVRSYDVRNEIVHRQMEALMEVLAPVLDQAGEAVLARVGNDLFLNGGRIPVRRSSFRFHQALVQELTHHGLAGIRFEVGLGPEELEGFFRLLFDPEIGPGPALIDACRERGLRCVQPGLHATSAEEEARERDEASRGSGKGGGLGDGDGEGGSRSEQGGRALGGVDDAAGGTDGAGRRLASRLAAAEHARSLLIRTQAAAGTDVRRARRVVQPVVEAAQAGDPVVFGLSGLSRHDEGEYARSGNVCVLAVSMGQALGIDRKGLADLAVAALLRDAGLSDAPGEGERPPVERHPVHGARLIAQAARLDETVYRCLRVALEHHQHADDSGYPPLYQGEIPSVLSRLVSVADAYVSLLVLFGRAGRGLTPFDALGVVLGPWGSRFDPAARWALVQAIGLYPPGQIVLLDDGSWAVALAPGTEGPERPHVRLVRSADGVPLEPTDTTLLSPLPPERSVMRALTAEECAAADPGAEDLPQEPRAA